MNSSSRASGLPMLDWPSLIKESLSFPLSLLPQSRNFEQPILPGWFGSVTNITEQNSSAPETERAIVASQSYGRQLGRMLMDVLDLLIARVPEAERQEKAFEEFDKLREEIDDIKTKAATRRLDRIAADLTALKQTKPGEYRRVVAELRELLKGG